MATEFIYPNNFQMQEIERVKLPRLTQDRPPFQLLPLKDLDAATLAYEQLENIKGLQQVRGLGGDPRRVNSQGAGVKFVEPGYYGEFGLIDEAALTMRRQWGTMNKPVDISDLVMEKQDQLLQRRLDRIEKTIWDLLVFGTFTALGPVGQVLHTDAYAIQTFTAGISWAVAATATPLANLRALKLLARGTSSSFGAKSSLFINQGTFNGMAANINANDLGSKRAAGLSSITGIDAINEILMKEDLPTLKIYDEGYFDENGTFQLFIPTNRGVLIGVRNSGTPIGQYQMTRNANNPDLSPGAYMRVIDNLDREIPRKIQVHDGHNGGPVLFFPGSVASLTL